VDELAPGPDGHWQAVVSVRSENRVRIGMHPSEIQAYLIDADGQALRDEGNFYKASAQGGASGLPYVEGRLWMQQGDVVRVRLLFKNSREVRPARLRLGSTHGDAVLRTFDIR
jgi:hypothetical protein